MEAWVNEAKCTPVADRIRCPACNALFADFLKGVYLTRCQRCKGKYLVISLPEIKVVAPVSCVHDDEAYKVICPLCGAPLGEFLIGVYRIKCFYCKWVGLITRKASSLRQDFVTLQEPKWRNTAWQAGKPASEEPLRE